MILLNHMSDLDVTPSTVVPDASASEPVAKPKRSPRKVAPKATDAKKPVRRVAKKEETEGEELPATEVVDDSQPLAEEPIKMTRSYIEAVGRRKTAVARVRLWRGVKPSIVVNGKPWDTYFPTEVLQIAVSSPLKAVGQWDRHEITCLVKGGGTAGQAEAVRHGISRVMLELNPVFRKALKKSGYLTRDPRRRERKKPGLYGARRAPQFSKR